MSRIVHELRVGRRGRRLEVTKRNLGPVMFAIVVALVVADRCWREIGDLVNIDGKTGKAWAINAVRALALQLDD